MLMSMDRIHDEVWRFVQHIAGYQKGAHVADLTRTIDLFNGGNTISIILAANVLYDGMVYMNVYNNLTSKAVSPTQPTDDLLIIYTKLREGVITNLRSIEWKLNATRRSRMLTQLANDAITPTPVTNFSYEETQTWEPSPLKVVSLPGN